MTAVTAGRNPCSLQKEVRVSTLAAKTAFKRVFFQKEARGTGKEQ